jgi:hypothetical protein
MMDFKQAQASFKHLKVQFEAGTLNESEFKAQLEELMVQDEQGSWWMIGYETERWYRHDGKSWVQADPPGSLTQESAPRERADPQIVEKAEADKDRLEIERKEAEIRNRERAKEAGVLHNKGMMAQKEGKYDEAELLYRQSLAIAVDLKDEQGKANLLRQLAILTEDRQGSEKRERENAEKAARAKAEREAAEKAARKKARQKAAERAAREKSEREEAEREASFRSIFEDIDPKTAEVTAREKAAREKARVFTSINTEENKEEHEDSTSLFMAIIGGIVGFVIGLATIGSAPGEEVIWLVSLSIIGFGGGAFLSSKLKR